MANPLTAEALYVPRESKELVRFTVEVDGAPTNQFKVSVVAEGARPAAWADPDQAGAHRGYLTGELQPGRYDLYSRVESTPEDLVDWTGLLVIT